MIVVSASSCRNSRVIHAPHGKYASTEWIGDGDLGVATWFRSRNQIGSFGPLNYMHRSTYQIMGSKFGYDLEMG